MKVHLPLLGTLLLLLCPSLHGRPLRVLAWDDDIAARKLAIAGGGEATALKDLHPLSRSPVIDVKTAEGQAPLLQAFDRTDEKGKPAADPIRIPGSVKRPLVLLMPDEKAATGVRPLVLEDDLAGFRWGTIRLVNATGRPLLFRCEKKISQLPAGWTPVDVAPGGERRNMEVMLALREQPTPPLATHVWEHRDDMRKLVFVVPNAQAGEGPVAFKFILESRVDAEAAAGG